MPRVGIALGSNLGDRLANLRAAVAQLEEIADPDSPVVSAPVYRTEPQHCPPGSPFFYNSVVEIGFKGSVFDLLDLTQAIERKLGRTGSPERNAPRIIDVDLLYFGTEVLASERLVLPHPRISERRFVLQPLASIRPDLVLPGQTLNIATLSDQLRSSEPALVPVETGES